MPIFTNQATLSYNNTVTNSNIVTGNLIEALSARKNAVVSTYTRGDSVTYVVTVTNSSATTYTDLTLTDNLGAYVFGNATLTPLTYSEDSMLYYLNGVLQPTPAVSVNDGIMVNNINITPGGTALFVYQVETNGFAPLEVGSSITNVATISGGNLSETITVSETVTPETDPVLSISKSLSPTIVSENGSLTYTFVVQNSGNTATSSTDDLTITDTFDPVLQNITVTYNNTVLTPNTDYTYVDGVFTTLPGVITVPAATYTQDETGNWVINPGVSVITVTGTV